jgi:Tfp pilus assembly protein PilZ
MKPKADQGKAGSQPKERRNFSRKVYSGSIFFATRKQLFEGEFLNFSQAGLAIKVPERFVEGENLIVAMPFDGVNPAKCPARVVWCNGKGFGAKFVR